MNTTSSNGSEEFANRNPISPLHHNPLLLPGLEHDLADGAPLLQEEIAFWRTSTGF
jgi:hypothetical protein